MLSWGPAPRWGIALAVTLALALGAGGVLEDAVRASPAEKCGPSARLSGDATLIASLRVLLEARGIAASDDQPGVCPPVAVEVRAARPGYDLTISDAEGRMARKTIDRPETAAMIIESWARADLDALMPAGTRSSWHAPGIRSSTSGSSMTDSMTDSMIDSMEPNLVSSVPAAERPTPVHLRVMGESAVHRDQSLWLGASAGACVRLGWSCPGPQARFSQAAREPDTRRVAPVARSMDLLLAVQAPLRVGRVWLVPELAVGAGRLDRTLTVPPFLPMVELNGGGGTISGGRGDGGRQGDRGGGSHPPDQGGDNGRDRAAALMTSTAPAPGSSYHSTQYGPRASTGVTLAVPLLGGMSLAFTLSLGLPGNARAGLGLAYGPAPSRPPAVPSGIGR